MGFYYFSHLQDASIHPLLRRIPPRQFHQSHLYQELAHGDYSSHPLARRRLLWRLQRWSVDQLQFFVLSPNATAEETQATFNPLFDFPLSQEGLQIQNYTVVFEDFWKFYDAIWNTDGQVSSASNFILVATRGSRQGG